MEEAGLKLIAEGLNQYLSSIGQADDANEGFYKSLDSAGGHANAFQEVITGALRHVGTMLVDFAAQGIKAIGSFVGDSVGLAGDFEAGMNEFKVAAGKDLDTQGLQEFHDLFIQLGKDLPVSTSDVQQAAIELVKGGIDPATVAAGGLEQAIKFAAAAMDGDLVGAAEISSKIVAGWADVNATAADKSELLTHATDLLTKAANASSTDVGQLSQGLFNAQGIAKTAGVSLDDLTTTIAELAGDFSSSAEAGTSLKNFIARLQPTTQPAIDAMQGLGLYTDEAGSAFYDAQGNFVGFQTASQLLQDSLKGLTKEQQAATLQQIFGNDAMAAAAGLASRGADGYQLMADSLTNAMGVQEAGATVQAGYNTAMENAKGSVEAFQIQLGEQLLPILTSLLNDVITPGIGVLSDFASAVFGSDEAFARLSPDLQIIITVIDEVVDSAGGVMAAFDDAGAMSIEFGMAIGDLADDLGLPGDTIQDLVFRIQTMIEVLGDGGAASDTLGDAIEDLSGIWQKALGVVQNVAAGYQAIAQAVLPIVTKFVEEHGEEIASFFKTSYDQIIRIVNLALDLYNSIVPPTLHAIAGFISDHADDIQTILGGAWDVISGVVSGALQLIEGAIRIALDIIHGDWSKAWEDLQTMSAGFVESLTKVITGFLDIIAGFFGSSLEGIVKTWQGNWDQLYDIATQTDWSQVGADLVAGIQQGVSDAWGSFVNWLMGKAESILDDFKEAWGIASPAKEWMPVGSFAVEGIMQGLSDTWPALTQLVSGLGDDLIEQAADIANQVQSAIADSFSAGASIDRQIAKNLDDIAKNVLPDYKDFTEGALKEAQQKALAFADPTEGAQFFAMRSKQILEFAKLQKELSEAVYSDDRERIRQRMNLINEAQKKEISAFEASAAAKSSPTDDIIAQMQQLLSNKDLPGALENDAIRRLFGLLGQLQTPAGNPWANPAYSVPQSSYSQTTNLNMPIYTNQSPSVLQSSMAIAGSMVS